MEFKVAFDKKCNRIVSEGIHVRMKKIKVEFNSLINELDIERGLILRSMELTMLPAVF